MSDEENKTEIQEKVEEILKQLRHIDRVIWRIENGVYREDK